MTKTRRAKDIRDIDDKTYEEIYCPVSNRYMGKGKSGQNNLKDHLKYRGKISKPHLKCLTKQKSDKEIRNALTDTYGKRRDTNA